MFYNEIKKLFWGAHFSRRRMNKGRKVVLKKVVK